MSSIVIAGDTSGTVTLDAPDVAGTTVLTLPATSGALNTSGAVNVVPAGTAAAPAITTTGDTNTGIFFPAADTIAFAEGGAEAMRIDSSGNVGIGTTVMNGRLNVSGTTFINDGGGFALSVPSNSQGGNGVVFRGDGNGASRFWQIVSNTSSYGLLDFQVSASNTNASYSSKMVIDSSGNVLVAATSLASGVNGKLYVNGIITGASYQTRAGGVGAYGGNSFNINWTGSPQLWIDNTNIGTFAFTSDYRIKKNIETNTTPALERIAQIRPVTYELADYKELFKEDGVQREGFIAHELQAVIPSAVDGEKDAEDQIQSLKLDALCSVMVKAIQELNAKVEAQAEQIKALQGAE
jgi:hypothetical protein